MHKGAIITVKAPINNVPAESNPQMLILDNILSI